MASYPHASTGFNVAWLIKMPCAGRPYQTPPIRRSGCAGSLAVSQRASEAFVRQNLIYDVGMNNGDDTAY
jgi:hypothetical protein